MRYASIKQNALPMDGAKVTWAVQQMENPDVHPLPRFIVLEAKSCVLLTPEANSNAVLVAWGDGKARNPV